MKKSELDLNALRVLLLVVDAGSFSAAARKMGVPSNRLSRQILQLETDLGVRLLQRTTRRLGLTSTGQGIVDGAGPALAQLETLWHEASSQADEPKGHLRVAAPSDLFSLIRVDRIADFLRVHPAISLELLLSDDQVDLIGSGVDIALRAGTVSDEDLVARQLGVSRLIVVAGPKCLAEHGVPQTPAALSRFPCLASRGKNGHTVWPLMGPKGKAPIEVQTRLTVNGMGALIIAAKAGLGAALVPQRMAQDGLYSGALVHVMERYYFDSAGVFAVYPNRRHPTAALRAFLNFIFAESMSSEGVPQS